MDKLQKFSRMLHNQAEIHHAEHKAREVQSAVLYYRLVRRLIVVLVCGVVILASAIIPVIVWR